MSKLKIIALSFFLLLMGFAIGAFLVKLMRFLLQGGFGP